MSSKRWDLTVASKDKSGKWRSNKVGVIFEGDKGQLQIRIDPGISISSSEQVMITGWLPKDKDERGGGGPRGGSSGGGGGYSGGGDMGGDDIPFKCRGNVG